MASRILRASVAWLLSRKFLATCWVMPEAPSGRLPGLVTLAIAARDDADEVDAGMGEEALVLGGDEGLHQALGHGGDRHEHALLLGVFGEQPAVGGVEARHRRRLVVGELLVVGQAMAEMPEQAGDRAGAHDQAGHGKGQNDFEQLEHGPPSTRRLAARQRSPPTRCATLPSTYAFLVAGGIPKWASTEARSARARLV